MNELITLQSGESVEIYERHGMWRADANNIHFCGVNKQALLDSLKHLNNPAIKPDTREVLPVLSPLETFVSVINSSAALPEKQNAWKRLKDLSSTNSEAKTIVDTVLAKPISYLAQELIRNLGKTDFMEVTHEDLVKYVSNLVVRSYLIVELAGRFEIKR